MSYPKSLPKPKYHPLRKEIRNARLRHWQIVQFLGGSPSEGHLSRMMCGQAPMPERVEQGIKRCLEVAKREREQSQAA